MVTAAAGRALQALRPALPSGGEVSSLAVRSERGATTVEVQTAADNASAAERFAACLRESRQFGVVDLSAPAAKAEPGADRLHLRLSSAAEDGQ